MPVHQEVPAEDGTTRLEVSSEFYLQQKSICDVLQTAENWTLLEYDLKQLLSYR